MIRALGAARCAIKRNMMTDDERMMDRIEELLKKPFWVIDILPEQVKQDSPGQYFEVERFYLKDKDLRRKQLNVLLKLNCYYDFVVVLDEGEVLRNPLPDILEEMVEKKHMSVQVEEALIVADPADTHITMYNASGRLLELVKTLSAGEGLFIWQDQ